MFIAHITTHLISLLKQRKVRSTFTEDRLGLGDPLFAPERLTPVCTTELGHMVGLDVWPGETVRRSKSKFEKRTWNVL